MFLNTEPLQRASTRGGVPVCRQAGEGSRSTKLWAKPAPDLIRGTKIAYKAQSPGKLAPRNKAHGSGDRVNVLILGGLSAMRDVDFLVKLPEGVIGNLCFGRSLSLQSHNYFSREVHSDTASHRH